MGKIIGIDLGTSNSAAAFLEAGHPKIIPSAEGASQYGKAFPSYVAITKDGQRLVGEPAKRQSVSNPEGTLTAFKRKMGTDHKFTIHGKEYRPQELSAMVLQKIKKDAEEFLGEPVDKAVITVPAYFNDNQRQATKDAGQIAGFTVERLVNEPTAACLAYGLDKSEKELKIIVFDFGGGTLDCTLMEFGEGVFEVKATSGDTELGGTDMTQVVSEFLIDQFRKESGVDVSSDPQAKERMLEAAEKAKIELSTTLETEINLPFLASVDNNPKHFKYTLTRAKLEDLVRPVIEKCRGPIETALKDAGMTPSDVNKIILVGGPTRMPIVRQFVEDAVNTKAERGLDPMECVAMGAAIQGGVLSGDVKDILLLDVTPLSLGLETMGGVFTKLIEKNTTIPVKKSQVFSTAADNQPAVDIHILQGERALSKDNVELGKFTLTGIPPAPRGVPQIEVTFDIDSNGILQVSAKDKASGKEQNMQVTAPLKMSDDEIKAKMEEADKHAEEDRKALELTEARNHAESAVYTAEKTVEQFKDKLSKEQFDKIDASKKKVKDLMPSDDASGLKGATEELQKALQEVGASMYQQSGGEQAAPGGESGQPGSGGSDQSSADDDVVEGSYEKVDDNKK
jgi:molecular chaperone DnaK